MAKTGEVKNKDFDDKLLNFKSAYGHGGRLRWILCDTTNAPLDTDVKKFCKVLFSVQLMESYGLTETTAAATF